MGRVDRDDSRVEPEVILSTRVAFVGLYASNFNHDSEFKFKVTNIGIERIFE